MGSLNYLTKENEVVIPQPSESYMQQETQVRR